MRFQPLRFSCAVIIAVLVLFSGLLSPLAHAKYKHENAGRMVQGIVTYVSDGDTVWVKPVDGSDALDVRLQGIDAPESCQDYGRASQQALSHRVLNKTVTLRVKARDKYGRVIARVSVGHQDVGVWMVSQGHAWSYHFHKSAGPYAREEMVARQSGRGLWGNAYPMEPREFRRRTKCHKLRK